MQGMGSWFGFERILIYTLQNMQEAWENQDMN